MAEAEVLPPPPHQLPHDFDSRGGTSQQQRARPQEELQLPWPPLDIGMELNGGMGARMTGEGGVHPSHRPPTARDRVEGVRSRREEEYEQQILQQQQVKQQEQQQLQQQQQRAWQSYAIPFEPLNPTSRFPPDRRTRAAYSANVNGYPQPRESYREADERQQRQQRQLQAAPMDARMPQRIVSRGEEEQLQLMHKQRQWQTTDPHTDGRERYPMRTSDVMLSRHEEGHLQRRWQHAPDRNLPSRIDEQERIPSRREEEQQRQQQQQWSQPHRRFDFDESAAYSGAEDWHQDEPLPLPPPLYHDDFNERAPELTAGYQQQLQWQSGPRDGQSSGHALQHTRTRWEDERRQQQWDEPPQRSNTVRRASEPMGSRRQVEEFNWAPAAYGAKSSRPAPGGAGSRYEGEGEEQQPRYQDWQPTSHTANPRTQSRDAPNSPSADGWQSKPQHTASVTGRAVTSRRLDVSPDWQATGGRKGAAEQVPRQQQGQGRAPQWQRSPSSPRGSALPAEPWPKEYSHRVAGRYDSPHSLDMPHHLRGALPTLTRTLALPGIIP